MTRAATSLALCCLQIALLACSTGGGSSKSGSTSGNAAGSAGSFDESSSASGAGKADDQGAVRAAGQGGRGGGGPDTGAAGTAQIGTQDGGQAGASAVGANDLCDGSSSLRLAFRGSNAIYGCSPDYPCLGVAVLAELGGNYLYLDGQCNLYIKAILLGGTRVKKLTGAELDGLVADLRVAEWPPAGNYCDNLRTLDGQGSFSFYLDGTVIGLGPCTNGMPVAVSAVTANQYALAHFDEGAPLTGPVRYTLVPTIVPNLDRFWTNAAAFPLEDLNVVNPSMPGGSGMTAPIMLAEGTDAATLRSLREAWLQSAGPQPGDFIPVLDAKDGSRLELRVRDVLPLEEMPAFPRPLF